MPKSRHGFGTGLCPTPAHKVAKATAEGRLHIFSPTVAAPPQVAMVPKRLGMWLNDVDGNCHSADTEILTDRGWQRWSDYDGKSILATVNRQTLQLEYQAPLRVIRKDYDGLLAYGTHKGQDFALTPGHRFLLRPYKMVRKEGMYVPGASGYGDFEFRKVEDVPPRFLIPGAPSGFLGTRLDKLTIGSRQWDGTDFLRFLSLILSDGYASSGETHPERSSFCCFREDRIDMVRAFAYKIGMREEKSRPGVWIMEDVALADWLRTNLYASDVKRSPFKKVPDLVKVASQTQIEEFLRFYGDQASSSRRVFWTSSKWLADDLQELLLRTGKRANIGEREPRPGGVNERGVRIEGKHPAYTLNVWEDSDVGMLGPNNKKGCIAYEHYKGEVFCATVPNSTLVTRRNGSVLVSGNCVTAEEAFAVAAYSTLLGLPEVFIPDQSVLDFCNRFGVLNGAELLPVMQDMQSVGLLGSDGKIYYRDGVPSVVDYTVESVLQAAIALGPVKVGIMSSALPDDAGRHNGWSAFSPGENGPEDHCFTGDTKISLLDGREMSFFDLADGAAGESFWVYSCDANGNIVPGKAHSVRRTRENAELIKVVLDNGEAIRCTGDHRFLMRNGEYKEAKSLQAGDSLMPLYRKVSRGGYELCYNPGRKKGRRWHPTHRSVAWGPSCRSGGMHAHHVDFNKRNNSPENLRLMTSSEHALLHEHLSEYNRTSEHRTKARQLMKALWDDPVWAEQQRARLAASASARGKRTAELGHGYLQTLDKVGHSELGKRRGMKLKGRKRSQVSVKKGSETIKKRIAEDPEFRESRRLTALTASQAAALKPVTDKQRQARRANAEKLNARKVTEREQLVTTDNHKVVSVELCGCEDVYDLTVDEHHNFALTAGVFVHNCVSLAGYGPASWLAQQLGVPAPPGAPSTAYLLFTWSTIGMVSYSWIRAALAEAYLRSPTTLGLTPSPPPTPSPSPQPRIFGLHFNRDLPANALIDIPPFRTKVAIKAGDYNVVPAAPSERYAPEVSP